MSVIPRSEHKSGYEYDVMAQEKIDYR